MRRRIGVLLLVLCMVLMALAIVAPASANQGGCPPAAAVGGADVNQGNARDMGMDAPTLAYENQLGKNPTLIAINAEEGGLGHGVHGDNSAHGFAKQEDHGCI